MKRKLMTVLVAGSMLLTSGCGAVMHDLRDPGGYPGWLLDRHSFNASSSKQLILLRATIVLAMAARMGQATVRGEDAGAFAHQLAASAREINYAAADLYDPVDKSMQRCSVKSGADAGPADPAKCAGYAVNFESEVPLIEARLIKTLIAGLPADKARAFLTAVVNGDALGAAFKALGTFRSVAAGLHYANGSYRTGLEIVATQAGCSSYHQNPSAGQHGTVHEAAVDCLQLPVDSLFSRTDHNRPNIDTVDRSAFDALMLIANNACTALPYVDAVDDTRGQKARDERKEECGGIWFAPKGRLVTPAPPAGGG